MTATETALPLAERRDIPPDAVLWMGKANGWATQHFTTNQDLTLYVRPVATALRRGVELVDEHGTVFAASFYVDSVSAPAATPAPQPAADDLAGRILAAITKTAEIARITAGGGGLPDPQWTTQPSRSGKWKILRTVDDATPIGYIDDGRWEVRHIVRNGFAAMITRAMQAVADAPAYPPESYEVHPAEYAWIKNPVGDPPSWRAVMVAWKTGAIDADHRAAQEMMTHLRGERS